MSGQGQKRCDQVANCGWIGERRRNAGIDRSRRQEHQAKVSRRVKEQGRHEQSLRRVLKIRLTVRTFIVVRPYSTLREDLRLASIEPRA